MKTPATSYQQPIDEGIARMGQARTPFAAALAAMDLGFALADTAECTAACAHCGSDDLASFSDDDNVRCRFCGVIDEPAVVLIPTEREAQ